MSNLPLSSGECHLFTPRSTESEIKKISKIPLKMAWCKKQNGLDRSLKLSRKKDVIGSSLSQSSGQKRQLSISRMVTLPHLLISVPNNNKSGQECARPIIKNLTLCECNHGWLYFSLQWLAAQVDGKKCFEWGCLFWSGAVCKMSGLWYSQLIVTEKRKQKKANQIKKASNLKIKN